MPRINTIDGLFVNGDESTNTEGTPLTAEWLNEAQVEIAASIKRLSALTALPTEDVGPIWHDSYNSVMIWQVFDQNGASYAGYASVLVGSLLLDTQPVPRAGYVRSGVVNLSRTTYAALRAWAQHHGRMVSSGVWAAGQIVCADNVDGTTYRIYDVRGEYIRCADEGRGIDIGRVFGSFKDGTYWLSVPNGTGNEGLPQAVLNNSASAPDPLIAGTNTLNRVGYTTHYPYGYSVPYIKPEPRSTALLPCIKY